MSYADLPDEWLSGDDKIIAEAKRRFKACEDWEATARVNFEYDYKFANGDSVNMYQWDNWVVGDRIDNKRPCLTINKTMQHCLQIINDGKQNKPGVNIRPVGDTASFEAAQIFEEVVRHIEYISNAETIYDSASEFQVLGGIGYWRITTDYISDDSFDQEIFLKRVKDPRAVYLDPDIDEIDGSDARFGFVFVDKPTDLYRAEYPEFKDVGGSNIFTSTSDGWFTKNHVRVCEYYRKTNDKDQYIWFVTPETQEEIEGYKSQMPKEAIQLFNEIKKRESNMPPQMRTYKERDVVKGNVEWFKIAGNVIIDRKPWLGKYVPIIRVIGRETIIDGQLDRSGHVRPLLDPQRIYNVNSSANVEYGALQSKSPITAPLASIEGLEEIYAKLNTSNPAIVPYNNYDEDGRKLDRPERMVPPQPGQAYVEQMKIAQNEMMMVSGQYQAQMGENENAKSGVAINQRQRQGDRATFHFVDGLTVGTRHTGKQLIDLIPKIYDTKRVLNIQAKDGTTINLTIDPKAPQALEKKLPDNPDDAANQKIVEMIFNPNIGKYSVISDAGPSFATRRQEAFNALTQIAANNKEFMGIAGDILWKVADFPEAQVLAERYRKIIPPNISGDAPNPQLTQAMQQAAQQIEQQLAVITKQQKDLEDKTRELDIKERQVALQENVAGNESILKQVQEIRADFDAITKRITAIGNSGPAISMEQIGPLIQQTIMEALANGGELINLPGIHEGGTHIASLEPVPPKVNGVGNNA
jgi:hypothetical protein